MLYHSHTHCTMGFTQSFESPEKLWDFRIGLGDALSRYLGTWKNRFIPFESGKGLEFCRSEKGLIIDVT